MNSRFLRWGIALAACVCVCVQPALGATLSPEVARGLAWLQAQVTSDGRVAGEASSAANVHQVRTEVATTLGLLSPPAPQVLLDQIATTSPLATELLARKAIALQSASRPADATLAELAASQNADGGFGGEPGFASNPLDTAWALLAWAGQAQGHAAEIKAAVQWLAAAQQATGGWLSTHDGQDAYVSAMAIEALAAYRAQFALASPLSKGRSWLAAQKASNNSWGSDAQTAVVLRALLPAVSDARPYQGPIDALMARQAADGSWQGDAYTSAIVLRVLQIAAQPVTNPDLASITGVIKDAATGSPIASATVSLNGGQQTALTDSTGKFLFQALPPGEVRLGVSAAGYRGRETGTILTAGAAVDYGDVLLKKADVSGVSVTGFVYYTPASGSRYAASSATVKVGGVSVQADSQGKYTASGLPAGRLTLVATYGGASAEQTFSASDGDSVALSPEIVVPAYSTRLSVTLIDAETRVALKNCGVSLNSQARTTNYSGVADFSYNILQIGTNTLSAYNCNGYANAYSQIVIKQGEVANIQLALTRQQSPAGTFQLDGRVVDGSTGLPIPGATIAIPSSNLSAVSNTEGYFQIQSASVPAGSITVTAVAAGYGSLSQQISSVAGVNTMNVILRPEPSVQTTVGLEIVVTDGVSGQPLQGAVVSISGANVRTLNTALDGVAKHAPVSAGSTTVKISYPGRITSIANLDVKAGISYRVPVTLTADQAVTISLHGVVTDTQTLLPVAGAAVALTGASAASAQTDSAGRYELLDLTAGEYTVSVRKDAYQVFSQAIRLTQETHANIPLVPLAAGAQPGWLLYGNVIDGGSFERIAGVPVIMEEMVPGMGAVARYSAVSAADGGFDFSGLGSSSARLMIQAEGYDSVIAAVERDGRSAVNLGGITLKRSLKVAGPDLLLKAVDRTGVTVDPATYRASGKVSVIARNNSTFAAGAFDVSVFIDRDNDGALGATDTLISAQRLASGLAAGAERQIDFDLSGATFHFRDEPLSVMVDSQQEVPEAIESNNIQVVASSCAAGGNLQDVVICLDNSGSVSSFIPIEVEGAIKAIENPNIIPQDGSIRLTVTTSGQAYYYGASYPPSFPARILTPESALSLAKSMKTWNYGGGIDYLETSARNMSAYLKTLTPASTSKTIILVGDGYWAGGGTATTSTVAQTVANGVTRIDLIGVGNVHMPELLDNAWPKPANTPGGGNVSVARSSGEIAGAMAQSLGNAVRLTDLSVGGLRIEDAGQGRPVSLLARVGNGGRTSLASTLRFYHGARLLGEVPVPTLATGTFVDLRLDGVSVSGDGDLRAVVDETKANSECNLSNNVHGIALLAARPVGQIAVSTDRPTYAMGDAVRLHAVSTNKGAVPAEFKMKLRIEDASGTEVLAFAEQDLGVVASGAEVTQNDVWASAGFRAGAYVLVGTLMASDGSVVAEDRAAFAVSASAGASLRTTTDKATYGAGEWVTLQAAVSNLAVNASLSGARVTLKVIDPKDTVVYTLTRSLGEIGAMATREIVLPKALMAAATGRYVVESVLSSAQGQTLAQGRAFFDVSADVSTVLAGQVDLSRDIIQRGDLQLRGDTIHNRSGLAIGALKIARVILRESDGKEVHRVESSLAFAAGETKRLPPLSIESLNLAQGNYIAVLQVAQTAQIQRSRKLIQAAEPAGWQVLSAASFLVTESAVTPLTPAAPTPVPTLSDFALLMLAALLGLMAWARRPARG